MVLKKLIEEEAMKDRLPLFQGEVNLLGREKVFQAKFFYVEHLTETHRKFDNTMSNEFEWTVTRRRPCMAVLIHNVPTNEIVLVEQFRPATMFLKDLPKGVPYKSCGRTLEVVAGGLGGDTPEECAKRESLEEANIKLDLVIPIPGIFPSPGGCDEFLYMFYAPIYNRKHILKHTGGLEEENEDTLVHWIGLQKARKMLESGELTDGKTVYAIQWLLLNKLKLTRAPKKFVAQLHAPMHFIDASFTADGKDFQLPAGTYNLEEIKNPFGHIKAPWLVIEGTKKGATRGYWYDWPQMRPENDYWIDIHRVS